MAGGGTGGHVIPALAVARELRARGHSVRFIGTRRGMEAKLVPAENFPIEWIEIGGLKRVGLRRTLTTLAELPWSVWQAARMLDRAEPGGGVFDGRIRGRTGAARGAVEAIAGGGDGAERDARIHASRLARFVARALVSFPETARWFPKGRAEVTGLPVRDEFFAIAAEAALRDADGADHRRQPGLADAESRGGRELAAVEEPVQIRLIHQTGARGLRAISRRAFAASGIDGEITAFLDGYAARLRRSGSGGQPVRDGHGERTGCGGEAVDPGSAAHGAAISISCAMREAFEKAGAARLVLDSEMTGARLVEEVTRLADEPGLLEKMGERGARRFAQSRSGPAARRTMLEVVYS